MDHLLLAMDALHPVLVPRVDVDPGVVNLVYLANLVQVVVLEVADRVIGSSVVHIACVVRLLRDQVLVLAPVLVIHLQGPAPVDLLIHLVLQPSIDHELLCCLV